MAIEWDDSLSTGVVEIDNEHKEWIRRFNEFDKMVMEKKGPEVILDALNFFDQYAEYHFSHEEASTQHFNNTFVEKNKSEHQKYRQQIMRIRDALHSFGEGIVQVMALKIDLEDWLINHISKTDVKVFKEGQA